jgi:tetratricopeptide (TPR) repeat protein
MKRITILVVLLFAIPVLKAQKKEIRKAQQEVRAGNLASAATYLSQAKRIFAAADHKTRSEYYVVEAEMRLAEKELDAKQIELISQSLKLAKNYEVTSSLQDRISQINLKIKGLTGTVADGELAKKNYSNAATLYKIAYQAEGDTIQLLKAARCYLLAKAYDDAYKSYSRLFEMGYTNAKTQYVATNVASNKKEAFFSTSERAEAIAEGLYKNPEIITTNSKLPEILRGITVAAIDLDKKYEAVAIIDRALAKMPEDKMLLNQVSHLYRQLDAIDKYYTVVDQLIKETPNDPNIYYNSAVTSAQNNHPDRAEKYYKKALEIDPDYINAEVNLSLLLLEQDKLINDEMNTLGASETDNERYEKLKQQRIDLYREVLPYLESIVKSQPQNNDFAKKLINIYSFLGNRTHIAVEENIDE